MPYIFTSADGMLACGCVCMWLYTYSHEHFCLIYTYTHNYAHTHTNTDRECVTVCLRAPMWGMVMEVTSLKSSHWRGPACDPWPLRHINHNPFLLAFISPAESYCPASNPTHQLHQLSALAIHKDLINFRPQVSLHHYTFIRSCSYQPAGPEYGNGIPATDKDGLDYPWLSFIR